MQYYNNPLLKIDNATIKYNRKGQLYCSSVNDGTASSVVYLDGSSELNATNVQDAIDALLNKLNYIDELLDIINGEVI